MLQTIINELVELYPAFTTDNFTPNAILESHFFIVELGDIEKIVNTSHQLINIYIYSPRQSHFIMKGIRDTVIKMLKNKHFVTSDGVDFWLEYGGELFTKIDHEVNKKCKCLQFKVPIVC